MAKLKSFEELKKGWEDTFYPEVVLKKEEAKKIPQVTETRDWTTGSEFADYCLAKLKSLGGDEKEVPWSDVVAWMGIAENKEKTFQLLVDKLELVEAVGTDEWSNPTIKLTVKGKEAVVKIKDMLQWFSIAKQVSWGV